MKCKITILSTTEKLIALDHQITKAKSKLEELKRRKILLHARMRIIREKLNEAKIRHNKSVACGPDDSSKEICDMFGKALSLENGDGKTSLEEQLGVKLKGLSLDQK